MNHQISSSTKTAAPDSIFVADIFSSYQGEGKFSGKPSLFLRLGICNLQCSWCDTPYTWKKGHTDYKKMSTAEIIKQFKILLKKPLPKIPRKKIFSLFSPSKKIRNLVITGGEPLLQQNSLIPFLQQFFKDNSFKDFTIEFETNGSMPLLPAFTKTFKKELQQEKISFNISPKLKDSGNKKYAVQVYPNSVYKFVYVDKSSEKLILDFLKIQFSKKMSAPVTYIMPEGTSVKNMEEKQKDALIFCFKNGFFYSPRLHIYLFGNKRAT